MNILEYAIFMGQPYYPSGGNADFVKYVSSIKDGIAFVEKNLKGLKVLKSITSYEVWITIAKTETMTTIKSGRIDNKEDLFEWQDGDFDFYKSKL